MLTPTFACSRAAVVTCITLLCGACSSTQTTRTTTTTGTPRAGAPAPTAAPSTRLADAVEDVFARTNAARRSNGMTALTRSQNLMSAAQLQADQMAQTGVFEHEIPQAQYPTLKSRLAAVQYEMRAAGENIAEGQRDAAEALSTWMSSAGHRGNILSRDYSELGTGVALGRNGRLYWVQVFGRPARAAATRTRLR